MIKFAETQKGVFIRQTGCFVFVDGWDVMKYYIGESLTADDCAYCNTYICDDCPLGGNVNGCCDGLIDKLGDMETWERITKGLIKIREYIIKNG